MGEPESVDQPKNDATLFAQMKERLFSAVISDALDQVGVRDRVMRADLRPLDPSMVICGRAFTILSADVYEKNRDPYEMEIDVKAGTKCPKRVCGRFLGLHEASLRLSRYSIGLIAPRDILMRR